MKLTIFFIAFFLQTFSCAQEDSIELFSINSTFQFTSTSTIRSAAPITAFDLGTKYLAFAAAGNISVFDLQNNIWKTQNFRAFTKRDVNDANMGLKIVTGQEINILKIDNQRNKIGYTLSWAMFKDIEINTLKTDVLTFQGSTNHELVYLKKADGYARFTKFYPDETSMNGELDIYLRKDINKNLHHYARSNQMNVVIPKISSLKFNENEEVFGGKTHDDKLLLWNKNKPYETNTFVHDTFMLVSFEFTGNDSIVTLYSDGSLFISSISSFNYQQKITQANVGKNSFDSFIYNKTKNIFIGSINHSELIVFRIQNGAIVPLSEIQTKRIFREYKISEDGIWLSIL